MHAANVITRRYQGQFKDGVRVGLGVETMPNGIRYAGNFVDSVPNGLGIMQFPHEDRVYAGEWVDDFPEGCGISLETSKAMGLQLRHMGKWTKGDISDPHADCHVEVNAAHEAARAAFAAAGAEPYEYTEELPARPPTKDEVGRVVCFCIDQRYSDGGGAICSIPPHAMQEAAIN